MKFQFFETTPQNSEYQNYNVTEKIPLHKSEIRALAVSSCGSWLATGSYDGSIKIMSLQNAPKTIELTQHSNFVTTVKFHIDRYPHKKNEGKSLFLYSTGHDGNMVVYDVDKMERVKELCGIHKKPIVCACVLDVEDGMQKIITGGWDNLAKVTEMNFRTMESMELASFEHENNVLDVVSSGGRLYSACGDNDIYVWDIGKKILVKKLKFHTSCVRKLYLEKDDGNRLLSTSNDGHIAEWNINGELISSKYAHENLIYDLFCDNNLIFTCSEDKQVKIWRKEEKNGKTMLLLNQSLDLPCCAWGVTIFRGKITVACSDGNLYLFSKNQKCDETLKQEIYIERTKAKQREFGINEKQFKTIKEVINKKGKVGEIKIAKTDSGVIRVFSFKLQKDTKKGVWVDIAALVDEYDTESNLIEDIEYESDDDEVDIEKDDMENAKWEFYTSKKRNQMKPKDILICDKCKKIVTKDYYLCFFCLDNYVHCKECFSKESIKEHKHSEVENSFHFMEKSQTMLSMNLLLRESCCETMINAFKTYKDRFFVGSRDSLKKKFKWITYGKFGENVVNFSSALEKVVGLKRKEFVGVISKSTVEFAEVIFSCIYLNLVCIPVQTFMSDEQKEFVITNTEMKTIICTEDYLEFIIKIKKKCPKLKNIIVISKEKKKFQSSDDYQFYSWDKLMKEGEKMQIKANPVFSNPEDIVTIIHSSGTTGNPKGVVIRESGERSVMKRIATTIPFILLAFCPLSHGSGRDELLLALFNGGRIGFLTNSKTSNLLDDLKTVNPTTLSCVPRIFNLLQTRFKDEVNRRIGERKKDKKIIKKIKTDVLKEMREENLFGKFICSLGVGGAKCSFKVKRFIRKLFRVPVFDTYGSSECFLISYNHSFNPNTMKIRDCPSNGYYLSDKPYPRGELLFKINSPTEYFKEKNLNKEKYTEDGYFCTGDIVELIKDRINVIDRLSNIKMCHGEFISLERIENILRSSCDYIHQILVDTNTVTCVAVVVPSERVKNTIKKEDLLSEINRVSSKFKLNYWEKVTNVGIVKESFSRENGLMTVTNKIKRRAIKDKYKTLFKDLFDESKKMASENIEKLVMDILGGNKIDEMKTFEELGGDSLSQISFLNRLKSFGKKLDLMAIKKLPICKLRDKLEDITKDEVYVNSEKEKEKAKVLLNQLSEKYIKKSEGYDNIENIKKVFITGSTGFLGKFLLYEILKQFKDAIVFCLVRKDLPNISFIDENIFMKSKNRLVKIEGDLSLPFLGMKEIEFNSLCNEKFDLIVHNGAMVNHFVDYNAHYKTNVLSAYEILKLSRAVCPILYISSTSVFSKTPENEKEFENLENMKHKINDGYSSSKFVADEIFRVYENSLILRPSLIFSCKNTGDFNRQDWINLIVKSIILTKSIPIDCLENNLNLNSVNYISYIAIRLCKLGIFNKSFNLNYKNLSVKELVKYIVESVQSLDKKTIFKELKFTDWIDYTNDFIIHNKNIKNNNVKKILPFLELFKKNRMIGTVYEELNDPTTKCLEDFFKGDEFFPSAKEDKYTFFEIKELIKVHLIK